MRTQAEVEAIYLICAACPQHTFSVMLNDGQCGKLACGCNRKGLRKFIAKGKGGCPIGKWAAAEHGRSECTVAVGYDVMLTMANRASLKPPA